MVNIVIGHHYTGHNDRFIQTVLQAFDEIVGRIVAGIVESLANIFESKDWLVLQPNISEIGNEIRKWIAGFDCKVPESLVLTLWRAVF